MSWRCPLCRHGTRQLVGLPEPVPGACAATKADPTKARPGSAARPSTPLRCRMCSQQLKNNVYLQICVVCLNMENPVIPNPVLISVAKITKELMIVIREDSAMASYYC